MLTALNLPLEVWALIVNQPALDMPSVGRFSCVSSECRTLAHQRREVVTLASGILAAGLRDEEGRLDGAAVARLEAALGTMHGDDGAWPRVRVAAEVLFHLGACLDELGAPDRAVGWLRRAAEQGNADAQCTLGACFDCGEGVEEDKAEALRCYRLAAAQGNAAALYSLGCCYVQGAGVEADMAEAVRWWRQAAEKGDAEAQYSLGCSYMQGEGVAADEVEAARWYRRSADQGYADALYNVGACYENGTGVGQDMEEAVRWYRLAAAQGIDVAQLFLGVSYANGVGVAIDKAEAAGWFRLAAEQGNSNAQYHLAFLHLHGEGVGRDAVEAARWFEQAAEQGDPDAQCCLGMLLFEGRDGVDGDVAAAGRLFRLAAEKGHGPGCNWLGFGLLANGAGAGDAAEARGWFQTAIDADLVGDDDGHMGYDAAAQRNLGLALEAGVGGDVDVAGAAALFREGAVGEHPDAIAAYSLSVLASAGAEGTTAADAEPLERLRALDEAERAGLAKLATETHELLQQAGSGSAGLASLWVTRALAAARELGQAG